MPDSNSKQNTQLATSKWTNRHRKDDTGQIQSKFEDIHRTR